MANPSQEGARAGAAASRPSAALSSLSPSALKVSIVVPAFNESSRLTERALLLNDAAVAGVVEPETTEVIVVDDGSTDDTAQVARQVFAPVFPRLRVLRLQANAGKGAAVRLGTAAAAAPIVAFMDADMAVAPAQIDLLLDALEAADIAVGSRIASDGDARSHQLHRFVMGRAFNMLANALTDVHLKDTQCGFKAFRTPVARMLFHLMVTDRFAFDVEVLSLARQLGLQIVEVPVEWHEAGNSTVRPFVDSLAMALDVCRIRWRTRRPPIAALEVGNDAIAAGHHRGRMPFAATSIFRKTDPIVPLSADRAIVLLPLCKDDEIDGAARRLSRPSTCLTVRRRLISCRELTDMMPASFGFGPYARGDDVIRPAITVLKERRQVGRSDDVRLYPHADPEALSNLEA